MSTPARQPLPETPPPGVSPPPSAPVPDARGASIPGAWRRGGRARWLEGGLVALAALAWGAALYAPALRCGVVSDGWHLLYIGSQPLREAVATRLDYHFSPVAHLLDGLLWRAFGLHDAAYQVENLLSLGLLAVALYWLARRLFGEARIALVAMLLFLANASYFEIPTWPLVGNFQSFAALLYVAGVSLAVRSGRRPHAWRWALGFGLCALAAFFTYEPTLSLLAVGVLAAWLGHEGRAAPAPAAGWRCAVPAFAAAALVLAAAVLAKLALSAAGDRAFFLPTEPEALRLRALFLIRAVIAVFTLRSADPTVARILSGGARLRLDGPWFDALAAGALLALLGCAALALWKGGAPVRLATLWLSAHYLLLATTTVPESRHNLVAALPASMLASAALWALGDRLARRWPPRLGARPHAAALVPLLALLALVPGAARDIDLASRAYGEATAATRELRRLVEKRLDEVGPGRRPPLARVALVNLPAKVHVDGLGAYWFVNGAHLLVELASRGEISHQRVRFFHTHEPAPGHAFANGSQRISNRGLARWVRDRSALVLLFDPRSRTVVRADPRTWRRQAMPPRPANGGVP